VVTVIASVLSLITLGLWATPDVEEAPPQAAWQVWSLKPGSPAEIAVYADEKAAYVERDRLRAKGLWTMVREPAVRPGMWLEAGAA
jgi:hypothetical protein